MEISEAKYQELLADQMKAKSLETENAKLIATAENTKVALKEGRDSIAELKTKLEETNTALAAEKESKASLEAKATEAETVKADALNWKTHQEKIAADRKAGIDEMKTKLGEEFLTANAAFLDGLPEDKVEIFLKNHVSAIGGENKDVIVGAPTNGGVNPNGGASKVTEFDTAIQKGDVNAALSAIPSPFAAS